MTCLLCENELQSRWTDTHGIGNCVNCGLPYRFYHYENDVPVNKPPSLALNETGLVIAKAYWEKHKPHWVFPACFDITSPHDGYFYCGAKEEDVIKFNNWYKNNKKKFSALKQEETAKVKITLAP